MAGDITSTIRFIADASQAIGTMRALESQAAALNSAFARSQANFSRNTGAIPIGPGTASGPLSQIQTKLKLGDPEFSKFAGVPLSLPTVNSIDEYNKVFKTLEQRVVLNKDGMELFRTTLTRTTGDVDKAAIAANQLTRINDATTSSITRMTNEIGIQGNLIGQQLEPARQRRAGIVAEKAALQDLLQTQKAYRATLPPVNPYVSPIGGPSTAEQTVIREQQQAAILAADEEIARTEASIRSAASRQGVATRNISQLEKSDPIIAEAKARLDYLKGQIPEIQRVSDELTSRAQKSLYSAQGGAARLPSTLETVRQESPNLFNRLTQQGVLGTAAPKNSLGFVTGEGTVDTDKIYKSGADQLRLTRDLERGTTSLSGAIRDENGVLSNINASYAEGGRVIGRYGGALSGVQNFLRQTVNNFQKVVQWGLATTAVFAGLGLATSAISTIKGLDSSLTQLSITAQLSAAQTGKVFDDLATIAYNTATPLQEMVKAADDIALATKRADQSTTEWQANIKSLATSVGILTNITGIDTVKATDLLTSTMKQLNLQANDLPAILNKVAAVAGGQANSIRDVVSGLGAMAEAAQQANLSIDQTVGVVQVLGQVTSKSSSEIATSFKNLVGSVDSKGAQKAFAAYDINIKDTQGNLRNILDIYSEIQDKIKSGVIPESDVKALVKAIAGGPRRAPDAAALLANVDAIKKAAETSKQATNEAFVANAKYLDTIQAKITQIQVKFDTFIKNAFGPALKSFVNDLANILTGILGFLSNLDPQIIKTVLGLGSLIIAVKTITGVLKFFGGGFISIINGLKLFNAAAVAGSEAFRLTGDSANLASTEMITQSRAEIAALTQLIAEHEAVAASALAMGKAELAASEEIAIANANNRRSAALAAETAALNGVGGVSGLGGALAKLKGGLGGIGLAAGTGAVLGAVTGGGPAQILGNAALVGGLQAAVVLPGPWKLLGAAVAAAGFALTAFSSNSKDAEKSDADLSQQILASINQYKDAQKSVNDLTQAQIEAKNEFSVAQIGYKNGTTTIASLNSKVTDYAKATYDLKIANDALAQSFKDLSDSTGSLNKDFAKDFSKEISAAKAGTLDPEALKKLQSGIYEQYFKLVNPDLASLSKLDIPFTYGNNLSGTGTNASVYHPAGVYPEHGLFDSGFGPSDALTFRGPSTENFDLSKLTDATDVLKLFNEQGTELIGTFDHSAESVDLISKYLDIAAQKTGAVGDTAKEARQTFAGIVAQLDTLSSANIFVKTQDALLQTKVILGQISADDAKQGEANLKIYQQLIEAATKLKHQDITSPQFAFTTAPTQGTQEAAQLEARRLLIDDSGNVKTGPSNIQDVRAEIEALGLTKGLKDGIKLSDQQIYDIGTQILGLSVNYTSELIKQKAASDALVAVQENLDKLTESNLDSLASRNADIESRYQNGDITKKVRDSLLAGSRATGELDTQIQTLLTNLSENQPALDAFEESLSKIPGLENLAGADADKAASSLIAWIHQMDATGQSAAASTKQVIELVKSLGLISPDIKSAISVDTAARYKAATGPGTEAFDLKRNSSDSAAVGKVLDDAQKQAETDAYANNAQFQAFIEKLFGLSKDIEGDNEALLNNLLKDLKSQSTESLASKTGDIEKRFLAGDISKKLRDTLIADAHATKTLKDQFSSLLVTLDKDNLLGTFTAKLSKLPGLEDLSGKAAKAASQELLAYLDNMDLTGTGANKLTLKVAELALALKLIPESVRTQINVDINTRVNAVSLADNSTYKRLIAAGEYDAAKKYLADLQKATANSTASNNSSVQDAIKQIENLFKQLGGITGKDTHLGSKSGSTKAGPDVSELDLPDEIANATDRSALIQEAIKRARALQHQIPGADKEGKNDIVELLKGTQRILEVRGVKDDFLRKALEELAAIEKKRLEFDTKADTIQRIRVGSGSFAALANVPLNSQTGVSVGSPQGPITVNLNLNGQLLTPAQFSQLADQIGAAIKRQIGA